jgi:predicted membrane-bound spermidine synthase
LNVILGSIFFASGASALLFETLCFRQAGLMLGNSVWATSLVTSSFMGGLAIGNALAGARGGRLRRPLLAYAALEAAIGVTGLGLVLLLPRLTPLLAPAFTPLLAHAWVLNSLRFAVAFVLLLVPATAMGATLPVLARALASREPRFGRVLGTLYGLNTLGAVAGALAGEGFLIARFGIRGTGLCAAALNAGAVVAALLLSRSVHGGALAAEAPAPEPLRAAASRRLLAAAFLAGALLLSLEVAWFRLLLLFVFGTSLSFAIMLAVVLLGIGAGGLLAGLVIGADTDVWRWLSALALAAGAVTAWSYAALPDVLAPFRSRILLAPQDVLAVALPLMLPTSLLSGALFTLMGTALKAEGHDASRAAGALSFSNTMGAMFGPLLTTVVLLPGIGIERTVFVLACGYGAVALLSARPARLAGTARWASAGFWSAAVAYVALVALFPFGLMRNHFGRRAAAAYLAPGIRIEAYREGLTETITYLVRELWGEATSHRLLVNGFSMSGSHFAAARYMRLFVYWPVAVHPAPKQALLISYGVGLTAKALTQTEALESVDVVDISKDILELGRILFPRPGTFPLDDRRVRVHVEDGRFFLLTTDKSYDIITAEPPPPKSAGIVNLYSSEYFELIRKRLAPGGITSYWLPVYQLEPAESKAIIRGFCDVFSDCSLWAGVGFEWMLVGTRGFLGPVSEEQFGRQWRDPVVGPVLRGLGFDSPELLGTTFLADAPTLNQLAAGTPPLDDDHPLRISPHFARRLDPLYLKLLNAGESRGRFASSALIKRVWPAALRERTLAFFDAQRLINRVDAVGYGAPAMALQEIEATLTGTSLRVPVLVALSATDPEIEAARRAAQRGVSDPFVDELLAIDALGERDYGRAAERFASAERGEHADKLRPLRVLALGLAGRTSEAQQAIAEAPVSPDPAERPAWEWLARRFGPKGAVAQGGPGVN